MLAITKHRRRMSSLEQQLGPGPNKEGRGLSLHRRAIFIFRGASTIQTVAQCLRSFLFPGAGFTHFGLMIPGYHQQSSTLLEAFAPQS